METHFLQQILLLKFFCVMTNNWGALLSKTYGTSVYLQECNIKDFIISVQFSLLKKRLCKEASVTPNIIRNIKLSFSKLINNVNKC